jgi:hypothetical protein
LELTKNGGSGFADNANICIDNPAGAGQASLVGLRQTGDEREYFAVARVKGRKFTKFTEINKKL